MYIYPQETEHQRCNSRFFFTDIEWQRRDLNSGLPPAFCLQRRANPCVALLLLSRLYMRRKQELLCPSQSSHSAQILCGESSTPACLLPSPAEGQVPLSASQPLGPWGASGWSAPLCRYYLNLLLALLTPGCVFLRFFCLGFSKPGSP